MTIIRAICALLACGLLAACGGKSEGDPCAGVVCEQPPANFCLDEHTLARYASTGSCDPLSGECVYQSSERPCSQGCQDGACSGDPVVWGWVGVLEGNGSLGWTNGVQAYFAEAPSYPRAMPRQLDAVCELQASAGACELYINPALLMRFAACDPPCGEDQECVYEGVQAFCVDLPPHWNVGELRVEGLKAEIAMQPDEYDRYRADDAPGDLFDAGDPITASTEGGELAPFSLSARGVAHLEPDGSTVVLERGQPAVVSWQPADPGSRIEVLLLSGPHDPTRTTTGIICDAPDEAGSVEIAAELVDGFLDHLIVIQKFSQIMRYTRDVQSPYGDEIELIAGSVRGLQLSVP